MIRRILGAVRRWFYRGQHKAFRGDTFEILDAREATIPRKETLGRPPWDTEQFPAVCLFPETAAPALLTPAPGPELHPTVRELLVKHFGADNIAECVEQLFCPVLLSAA